MRRELFPEITPYETGALPLDGGHVMYWEQSGNPNGAPALFLHGGPGAGETLSLIERTILRGPRSIFCHARPTMRFLSG